MAVVAPSSHPTVEVITRDRWTAYANACSAGAPLALQVADRFHLVGNIRELVERLFEQKASALDAALQPPSPVTAPQIAVPSSPGITGPPDPPATTQATGTLDVSKDFSSVNAPPPSPKVSTRQQRRLDRFDEVRRLRLAGRSVRQIARLLRISPRTVIGYTRRERCPDWNPGTRRMSRLDSYQVVVDAFIQEGGRVATELHRRLTDQGCTSSYNVVR